VRSWIVTGSPFSVIVGFESPMAAAASSAVIQRPTPIVNSTTPAGKVFGEHCVSPGLSKIEVSGGAGAPGKLRAQSAYCAASIGCAGEGSCPAPAISAC